jgi:excisionase family DNA binding protein
MNRTVRKPVLRKLLSRYEAAEVLGVHFRTIDKLIKDGKLRGVKIGRRHMVDLTSADKLIAAD